jgi:ATP-dependent HslUV protease ATP-binding subunit HslU
MPGAAMGMVNLGDVIGKALGNSKTKQKKLTVSEAVKLITDEEADKMIDQDKIIQDAVKAVENDGIVFLDEIDKITSGAGAKGAEVSREGVQRDLLPLIEGTGVTTKYGTVCTDHVLFIASGAFHLSKPSDLLPELQGRLPIRVEMSSLTKVDLIKILTEPECNLPEQYRALLKTEGVELEFTREAIEIIAEYAERFNVEIENIGARRLHTILENLLEDVSFEAGSGPVAGNVSVTGEFVRKRLDNLVKNIDLAKFIL